jgi:hypothetical protein
MKKLLIATAAFAAIGFAASAQPAYDPGQGAAPSDYPTCSHPGQDRCVQGKMHGGGHHHGHHHGAKHHEDKDKDGDGDGH